MRLILLVLALSLVAVVPAGLGQVVNPTNGHAYLLTAPGQNLLQARFAAAQLGGTLVAINDAAEDAFLQANFTGDYWIGLSDELSEGNFVWDTGDPLSYTNWCPGEPASAAPNQDYVFMDSLCPGQWNDTNATNNNVLLPGLIELPYSTPLYQLNSLELSMDISGSFTSGYAPAAATKCTNSVANVNFAGGLVGNPWDMGYYFGALVPGVIGSGTVTGGNQVVNLDLTQAITFLNGVTAPNLATSSFAPTSLAFASGTALTASGQALIGNPGSADGFTLSQANQLDIVPGSASTQVLNLPDDGSIMVNTGPPLCGFGGISFYGTTYFDFFVNSNGSVSFSTGSPDFTPTVMEFEAEMPRVAGVWSDLAPNSGGTVQVVPNANDITVQFINVPEWGQSGTLNSFDFVFDDTGGTTIANYTPSPQHATSSLTGISNGAAGTATGSISFSTLAGAGLQVGTAASDSVHEANPGGAVPAGWTNANFPTSDGSVYLIN